MREIRDRNAQIAPDCAEFIIGRASRGPLAPSGLQGLGDFVEKSPFLAG
jgi:hypothetical protein